VSLSVRRLVGRILGDVLTSAFRLHYCAARSVPEKTSSSLRVLEITFADGSIRRKKEITTAERRVQHAP